MLTRRASLALREAHDELFYWASRLRSGEISAEQVESLRTTVNGDLRQSRRHLLNSGLDEETIDDVQMPIIALLDEMAQSGTQAELSAQWTPLQLKWHKTTDLGEQVFLRLDELLKAGAETPVEVLEVYARCLAWGLTGRLTRNPEDLRELKEVLRVRIEQTIAHALRLPQPEGLLRTAPLAAPILPPYWIIAVAAILLSAFATWRQVKLRHEIRDALWNVQNNTAAASVTPKSEPRP